MKQIWHFQKRLNVEIVLGERNPEGSAWEEGRMEGEYDETDYQKILELQMRAAIACDDHPELEEKTATLFESITPENAEEVLQTVCRRRKHHDFG